MGLMGLPRRVVPLATALSLAFLIILLLHKTSVKDTWRDSAQLVRDRVGTPASLYRWGEAAVGAGGGGGQRFGGGSMQDALQGSIIQSPPSWKDGLIPGTPSAAEGNYSRVLVVAKTRKEKTAWLDKELRGVIEKRVYVADDPAAPLHPPANKGHEAIVYLTYIIDNYDDLPDVMLFMHAHQRAWHNNEVLNQDAAEMVRRLNSAHVVREGYMNMRCQWYPGCPDWMHPGNLQFDIHKTEQVLIAKAWAEIFPFEPVPDVLAQPCCSQFALSRERVRSIPRERFIFYRDWLLNTKLRDFISGRVWEYMWQYAFTGQSYWCPIEHVCYCDGYGVCFGGREKLDEWAALRERRDNFNLKLLKWQQMQKEIAAEIRQGRPEVAKAMPQPEPGKDHEWWDNIQRLQKEMNVLVDAAKERGKDPQIRALEAGRPWKEGDGF